MMHLSNCFAYIGPQHSFYPHIQRFKTLFASDPVYATLIPEICAGGETQVVASLNARLMPHQGWLFRWLYFSFQSRSGPAPFRAVTLFYSAKTDQIECYEFPQDPHLTAMAGFFDGTLNLGVLRYVPKRRLTFRTLAPNALPLIGKFARRPPAQASYHRLATVFFTLRHAHPVFSVAAPMGLVESSSLFFQEARPGENLTALLAPHNFLDLLHSVGILHRDLHCLNIADLPEWDFGEFLENLTTTVQWISFFQPEQRPLLDGVRELLLNHTPRLDPAQYTFCHGDFSCPQILKENNAWSVVDFDWAMRGDPYLEIAKLMAFMKYDVTLFRDWFRDPDQQAAGRLEEACEAYLQGYEEKAQQSLNRKRLLWYRICFEIQYLVRLLNRDLMNSPAFDRGLELVRHLSQAFAEEKGGDF